MNRVTKRYPHDLQHALSRLSSTEGGVGWVTSVLLRGWRSSKLSQRARGSTTAAHDSNEDGGRGPCVFQTGGQQGSLIF